MELLADLSWDSLANRDNREESARNVKFLVIIKANLEIGIWYSLDLLKTEWFIPVEYEFMDEESLADLDNEEESETKLIVELNWSKK